MNGHFLNRRNRFQKGDSSHLQGLLNHLNAVVGLEGLLDRLANIPAHGGKDTLKVGKLAAGNNRERDAVENIRYRETYLLADSTIKNQLHGNAAGNTDELSHGGVTTGNTVLAESAGADLLGAVLVLDAELVLEHDQVTLVGAVLHLLLEAGA